MIEIPSLRPETRYGSPPADQLLFNREYIVGYSYLFLLAALADQIFPFLSLILAAACPRSRSHRGKPARLSISVVLQRKLLSGFFDSWFGKMNDQRLR